MSIRFITRYGKINIPDECIVLLSQLLLQNLLVLGTNLVGALLKFLKTNYF